GTLLMLYVPAHDFRFRRYKVIDQMEAEKIDTLLLFKQESMYYLTGYDSSDYSLFQCMVLTATGKYFLFTHAANLMQARQTSTFETIHIWREHEGADPTVQLVDIMERIQCKRRNAGIEYDSYGLSGAAARRLDASLRRLVRRRIDASFLVSQIRLIKSPMEQSYLCHAGKIGDQALDVGLNSIIPGKTEIPVLAAMQNHILSEHGDYSAGRFVAGSGFGASLCNYRTTRRYMEADEQLTLEWAGVFRHYHAPLMRTVILGRPHPRHHTMFDIARDALLACEAKLQSGTSCGEIFDEYARILDKAGFGAYKLNNCGHAVGASFPPSWVDWPMLYAGNPVKLRVGMVFFIRIVVLDLNAGLVQTLGRSTVIDDHGPKPLSSLKLELIIH
ncbi:MAG: Xaa-Pro peptidase family protein, partial [Pseudomonadota bacterium]